nr:unnamed protein product [Callosobruchus chinensis]
MLATTDQYLMLFGKILEILFRKRLVDFFESNELISSSHFGFRNNISCVSGGEWRSRWLRIGFVLVLFFHHSTIDQAAPPVPECSLLDTCSNVSNVDKFVGFFAQNRFAIACGKGTKYENQYFSAILIRKVCVHQHSSGNLCLHVLWVYFPFFAVILIVVCLTDNKQESQIKFEKSDADEKLCCQLADFVQSVAFAMITLFRI